MKEAGPWIGLTLVLALVFHVVTVATIPRFIMEGALWITSPYNVLVLRPPVNASGGSFVSTPAAVTCWPTNFTTAWTNSLPEPN